LVEEKACRCRHEIVQQQTTKRAGTRVATRTCGFAFTTTGRPCANHVADDEFFCRAGHPCAAGTARRAGLERWAGHHGHVFPLHSGETNAPVSDRRHRAAMMLARSLSHEDAEADGVYADKVLADPAIALALLGSPDADPAARDAVVQRFGLVGALLVIAYEDRWQRHLDVLSGEADTTSAVDEVSRQLERLLRNFGAIDGRRLEAVLGAIDRAEGAMAADPVAAARHRLHAAYAIAARDGSAESHREYMETLNEVLKTTRPAVAS
jgi:hypothetical protein